jgi:hypothetical protein
MSQRAAFGLLSLAGPCGVRTFRRNSSGLAPLRRGRTSPLAAKQGLRAAADASFPNSPYTAARLRRFREFERARATANSAESIGPPSRVEMRAEDSHAPDVGEAADDVMELKMDIRNRPELLPAQEERQTTASRQASRSTCAGGMHHMMPTSPAS